MGGDPCNGDTPPNDDPANNPGGPNSSGPGGSTASVGGFDPNDIAGPAGFGTGHYILGVETLPYTIRFENIDTATAPAQEVFVTHQLDADLDLSTFELDDIGFGDSFVIDVPNGLQSFATSVDYQNIDGSPLRVDVLADLDADSRTVSWTFRSIDPATGLLPEGVFDGFLPPNVNPGEGEGFVSYAIRANSGLTTGTTIDQQASIVFDVNDPILTNVYTNTIDAGPPTSSISQLPISTDMPTFTISWSGTDDAGGSGIASYDVLVSTDSGPFEPFVTDTTETSANFTGEVGRTYGFVSIARDNVGRNEDEPLTTDATITVLDANGSPAVLDVTGSGNPNPFQDGIIIVRFMFGQPDANLEDPALIPIDATRTTGAELSAHLDSAGDALDVNGDGVVNPFQDGILIVRYLFGQPDANLEDPALIPAGSTRTTGAAIRQYLDSLVPSAANGELIGAPRLISPTGEAESLFHSPVDPTDFTGDAILIAARVASPQVQTIVHPTTNRLSQVETFQTASDLALNELAWNTTGTGQADSLINSGVILATADDDREATVSRWDQALTDFLESDGSDLLDFEQALGQ